jgi:hypothetical protein
MVIIVDNPRQPPINAHKNRIDAWIISLDDYTTYIKDHLMQALITIWLPPCFVLKEDMNPKKLFEYSSDQLAAAIDKMHQRDLRVSQKHFDKNDIKGTMKVMRHCMRQSELALQIHRHHSIIDYTINIEDSLMQDFMTWNEFIASIEPHIDAILGELKTN